MDSKAFFANNLDQAYETLKNLNGLASREGDNLVSNLSNLIEQLKKHWIGSDATLHINNLIEICKGVSEIVNDVYEVAHDASKSIVNVQTIRNANGVGEVGEIISAGSGTAVVIAAVPDTAEYYVDPIGAPQDLTTLQNENGAFGRFCAKFSSIKEELLSNWTSGANRDKIVSDFEQFETNVGKFTQNFNDAVDNLSIAVSNLKQI